MRRLRLPIANRLEQQAALIGAGVSGLAAAGILAESAIGGAMDPSRILPTTVVSTLFLIGYVTRRAVVIPVAALGVLSSTVGGSLSSENRVIIFIAFVIFAAVFAAFGRRESKRLIAVVTVLALVCGWAWGVGPAITLMSAGGAGIIGYLVWQMRDALEAERRRSDAVLDLAPIMIVEHDWTGVAHRLRQMRQRGVTDLGAELDSEPELVSELIDLVRPRYANRATLQAYGADDFEGYVRRYSGAERSMPLVNDRSFEGYRNQLIALWDETEDVAVEFASYDHRGEPWWMKVHWAQHPEHDGVAIIAVADITELKTTQAELEQVNRSKDRFVASVSHELRTPLAAVVGFSNELVERGELFEPNEFRAILGTIRDEAQEAAHLIEDLLVIARADMGQVSVSHQALDLHSVVDAVQRSLHTEIVVEVESADAVVCGDALRVRQIVRNLVTNALRYGGEGRVIRMKSIDTHVTLEVCDDGTSLVDADLSQIFEPYSSAHARDGRTDSIGLGLAVSRILSEVMGGTLVAEVDRTGTTFRVELPRPLSCPVAQPRVLGRTA